MARVEWTRMPFGEAGEERSGAAAPGRTQAGAPWRDLSLPMVSATIERFPEATDEEIAELVEAMLGLDEADAELELEPMWGAPEPG